MHNVDIGAVEATAAAAAADPGAARQPVSLNGDWQAEQGRPQFNATIPYPTGEVTFECDFPPAMGGSGSAPNPLVYCLWGGLACYAMTFALEAARTGIELRSLRGVLQTEVDQSRALGVADTPPVDRLVWRLEVEADAARGEMEELKHRADERCPGVWCLRNPVPLETSLA